MLAFLFKVWGLARPYRARLFLGVLTGVISGLMQPLMIGTIVFVYGAAFTPPGDDAKPPLKHMPAFLEQLYAQARQGLSDAQNNLHSNHGALIALIAAVPLVMFLRGFFGYLNVYFLQWTASRSIADLRTKLFSHLVNLSAGFHSENSSGQLMSRVINDTQQLQGILSSATSVIIRDPITLLSVFGFLLLQQPKLTLISMIVLPACIVPIAIFSRKVRGAAREIQKQSAELTQIMSESFTGQRVIKAYNLEGIVTEDFRKTTRKTVGNYMRMVRAVELPGPMIEFFGACGVALMLAYMIFVVPNEHLEAKDFVQLLVSIFAIYQPIKNLTRLQNQLVQARAASERVFELLAMTSSIPEPAQPKPLKAARTEIEFDHVYFAYGEKKALQDITLKIRPGQLVALVGHSGSGKTTLANLLLRFYDPQQGAIRIGGTDLRDISTRDLRDQIAVVSQENVLFNETVRRNIELGRPGATEAEIIAAAKSANADGFIREKPQGYDTLIGEKGVMLSGGQRQRLAIARAVLRNAPILVLDEATSALDTESERAVQSALDALMQGRTTICIAHRLSTILHADVIVVLDQGRIVETGKHEELLQRGGIYQKLYQLQFAS